jgi:hypothetical protein
VFVAFVLLQAATASAQTSAGSPTSSSAEGQWSVAARVGPGYERRRGYFDVDGFSTGFELGVGRLLARNLSVGVAGTLLFGREFEPTYIPERLFPTYDSSKQLASLFIENRWNQFTAIAAGGVAREAINGGYTTQGQDTQYYGTSETFTRSGAVGSLGLAVRPYQHDELAFEVRVDLKMMFFGRGRRKASQSPAAGPGPEGRESALLATLWAGVRWN